MYYFYQAAMLLLTFYASILSAAVGVTRYEQRYESHIKRIALPSIPMLVSVHDYTENEYKRLVESDIVRALRDSGCHKKCILLRLIPHPVVGLVRTVKQLLRK